VIVSIGSIGVAIPILYETPEAGTWKLLLSPSPLSDRASNQTSCGSRRRPAIV